MTTKTRRAFTEEFKREAVSLLEGSGRPLTQVATELGIQPSMLRAWRGRPSTPAEPMISPYMLKVPPVVPTGSVRKMRKNSSTGTSGVLPLISVPPFRGSQLIAAATKTRRP